MKINRLAKEKSLYLRQHSTNPVDWYPWSEEAFNTAKKLDRPIFLSIGYSSCHWCHVMEEESFSDEEVASLMNKVFVNIKVDREERPDIDAFYMKVCQFMTGSGGWPLTIIMTPEQKPFFAGTYFPKHSMFGRIGLVELIRNVEKFWNERRDEINNATIVLLEQLKQIDFVEKSIEINANLINETFESLKFAFDQQNGGFGTSPKFPMPFYLHFLLDYSFFEQNLESLKILENTLIKMRLGGIFDQVEFGFHRYSTDSGWIVPHFEKMLYDQSLLLLIYSKAYIFTKKKLFKQVAEEITEYLFNNLKSNDSPGFYTAEDADSEGIEGKYYVFSFEELKEILKEELELFSNFFNINERGNFQPHNWQENGLNILHLRQEPERIAQQMGLDFETLHYLFSGWLEKLRKARARKVRPAVDNKVLTDWNGLALAGLSSAYKATNRQEIRDLIYSYFEFFNKILFDGENLYHSFVDGQAFIPGMVNDYVYSAFGFFEASQTFLDSKFLYLSQKLLKLAFDKFWDNNNGGLFISSLMKNDFEFNTKDFYDGVLPSSNSLVIYLSNAFYKLFTNPFFKTKRDLLLEVYSRMLNRNYLSHSFLVDSLFQHFYPTKELVIVIKNKQDLVPVQKFFSENFYPNVLIGIFENMQNLSYPLVNGQTTFYLCENFQCKQPTNDFEYISKVISNAK